MGKALHAELQKARRRHDLLICLAVPVVVYLWAEAAAPTGADELANAYQSGRGKLTLRARTHIEEGAAGRRLIVITEVPYQVNKAAMLEKILKLSEEKKAALGGIYDIRDESDRTGMRAVVEVKKEADADKVLAYLLKYSDLQVTFGVNMVAIADGKPRLMSLRRVLR